MVVRLGLEGANIIARDHPSECPICHVAIAPVFQMGMPRAGHVVECCYECTNARCRRLFLAVFGRVGVHGRDDLYAVMQTHPVTQVRKEFPEAVTNISSQFVSIFNEAYAAEQYELNQICGVGYRKSLEFLIKDYLIGRIPDGPEKDDAVQRIKDKFLGRCINEDIEDARIRQVAARAAWLGNDETHYVRRWTEQDVQSLKSLITLTVNFMENEALAARAMREMPDP